MQRLRVHHALIGITAVLLFLAAGPLRVWLAHGLELQNRSVRLSNNLTGATATYAVSFDGQDISTVGSLRIQFCNNDAQIGAPCTAPPGMDVSHAVLSEQSGTVGYSINTAASNGNTLVLSRTPGIVYSTPASYRLDNIKNPASASSLYARMETFPGTDASGSNNNYGAVAIYIVPLAITINSYVPPYLLFCTGITIEPYDCSTATGDYVDFGAFSPTVSSTGHTKLLASTNADGYTIRAVGNTLTSGNNEIPTLSTPDVSRTGVSQFGFNLRSNGTPLSGSEPTGPGGGAAANGYATPNFYKFTSGDVVAASPGADDYRMYTADYVVNVSKAQSPGVYVTTITYIALANF